MRPRPDAAENRRWRTGRTGCSGSFNEAAARCRGKPGVPGAAVPSVHRFNEAAARCRGKLAAGNDVALRAGLQ